MNWIATHDYFGLWANHPDVTDQVRADANTLLVAVNGLMEKAFDDGVDFPLNPTTKSRVAGHEFGGFRPQCCTQGAPQSSHKVGKAVDVYDGRVIDGQPFATWCLNNQDVLQAHGLYMEHPTATKGTNTCWTHLSTRAPKSGKRVFFP